MAYCVFCTLNRHGRLNSPSLYHLHQLIMLLSVVAPRVFISKICSPSQLGDFRPPVGSKRSPGRRSRKRSPRKPKQFVDIVYRFYCRNDQNSKLCTKFLLTPWKIFQWWNEMPLTMKRPWRGDFHQLLQESSALVRRRRSSTWYHTSGVCRLRSRSRSLTKIQRDPDLSQSAFKQALKTCLFSTAQRHRGFCIPHTIVNCTGPFSVFINLFVCFSTVTDFSAGALPIGLKF